MWYDAAMTEQSSPSAYFRSGSRAKPTPTSHLISVRLSDDLVRRLADVGNDEGLAMSDTIRLILERGLAAPKRKKTT
jgi:hypothetical protein